MGDNALHTTDRTDVPIHTPTYRTSTSDVPSEE